MAKGKIMLIVDGHALLHRAFHALPPLTNKRGEPTGAVFGFFSMLLSVIKQYSPNWLSVCFDSPVATFRHKEFVGYQAKRPTTDKQLALQIKRARALVKKAKIPFFIKPGFEADDLAATIAKKASSKAEKIFILTGDQDLMQLVSKKVNLLLLTRQMAQFLQVGPDQVEEKLGVKPSQVVDYKGLIGDSSDNYPGVPGIGPKTAQQLLSQYPSFSAIYRNLGKISGKNKEKLVKGREAGELSLKLGRINDRVPIELDLEKLNWKKGRIKKIERLKGVLKEEGFPSLVKRMEKFFPFEEKAKQEQLFN